MKYIAFLLDAKNGALLLIIIMLMMFVLAPVAIYLFVIDEPLYLQVALLGLMSIFGVWLGRYFSMASGVRVGINTKFELGTGVAIVSVFGIFVLFLVLTLATAPTIPILSAFQGASVTDLSEERGEFLKGREGGWIALLYISSILSSSIVPFFIILAYAIKHPSRHMFVGAYFLFSIVFLVKAMILNLAIPAIAYAVERDRKRLGKLILPVGGAIAVIFALVSMSGYGSLEKSQAFTLADYFSPTYIPEGPIDFIVYRSFSVPIFSLVDTLVVFKSVFAESYFYGTTSTLLSSLFGAEKINIERYVAEYQYGGWNDRANSNVAFFLDGYVNFGWPGVFIFSVLIGQFYRLFARSDDPCLRALPLLLTYQLISSPFIQVFLSNGWILIICFAIFIKRKKYTTESGRLRDGSYT